MQQTVEVINALNQWPLALVVIAVIFRKPIGRFINEMAEVRLKIREVELIATRKTAASNVNDALLAEIDLPGFPQT